MILGAHAVISSTKPDADRAFLRDVLGLPHVDAGGGWLIFGLPPSEVAVHPSKKNDVHELYFLCEDVGEFVAAMKKRRVSCTPIQSVGWGELTRITLPGGGKVGVYQPRHVRPKSGKPAKAGKAGKAGKAKATTATPTARRAGKSARG